MANMLHLRPVNGARVLDPDAVPVPEALPAEGKMVVDTPFWRRRLKAKEVELVPAGMQSGRPDTEQAAGSDNEAGKKSGAAKGK